MNPAADKRIEEIRACDGSLTCKAEKHAHGCFAEVLNVPFTFDLLRDPDWQPTREQYKALGDELARASSWEQEAGRLRDALERIANEPPDRGLVPNFREFAREALRVFRENNQT